MRDSTCISRTCFLDCSMAMMFLLPRLLAVSRAVRPRLSVMNISEPAVSSTSTTASCWRLQASMSAVLPCTVWQSMSAPVDTHRHMPVSTSPTMTHNSDTPTLRVHHAELDTYRAG